MRFNVGGFQYPIVLTEACFRRQLEAVGSEYVVIMCVFLSWGVPVSVHRDDNLPTFLCRLSRSSGNVSLLEPKKPLQAGNGLAYTCLPPAAVSEMVI